MTRPNAFDLMTSEEETALRDYLNALHGLREGTTTTEDYDKARLRLGHCKVHGQGTHFFLYLPDRIRVEVLDYGA